MKKDQSKLKHTYGRRTDLFDISILVPHSLTIQQKLNRKQISQRNLKRFKQNQTDFVRRFITMDETWIYHHDPKLKQERLQWIEAGSSAPKQVNQNDRQKRLWHNKRGFVD